MSVREKAAAAVRELLGNEKSMHDWEHSVRVCKTALHLCRTENGDEDIVALAALLHDCDDYKVFGPENAAKLTNARRILDESGADCGRSFGNRVKSGIQQIFKRHAET